MLMRRRLYGAGRPWLPAQPAMPRSFLVKKAASTPRPQLTGSWRPRRQNAMGRARLGEGWCFPSSCPMVWLACPPASRAGSGTAAPASPAHPCLFPQSGQARGETPGSSPQSTAAGDDGVSGGRLSGPPLRDNLNNLNLPSAFGLPPKRTLNLGSPAEGEGEKVLGEPGGAATPPERLECPDCGKAYHSFSGLARHRQLRCKLHSVARRSFNCKYCEKEYSSLGALKMHIRTHTLPCICRICSKAFSRPWLLQGHIRTHTGEKPYTCSHCSRAFADRSNLRAHLQTHSDVKKYQCHSCSKTFSRMSLLLRHEEAGCCPAT